MENKLGCPMTIGEYNNKTLGCPFTLGEYNKLYNNNEEANSDFKYAIADMLYIRQNDLWKSLTRESQMDILNLVSACPGQHNIFTDHFEMIYLTTLRKYIMLCKEHPHDDLTIPSYLIAKKE